MCVHCAMDRADHAPDEKCLFESTRFKGYVSPKLTIDPHELAELFRRPVAAPKRTLLDRV
jgi:hypothetical protein